MVAPAKSYYLITRLWQHLVLWTLPDVGSEIAEHTHPAHFCHDTFVISGTVAVTGEAERGDCVVTGPDYLRFDADTPHAFVAQTAGAQLVHIYPQGAKPNRAAVA